MKFKPKGIIPPVVTPFDEDGKIDYKVYKTLIDYLIDNGVHGIFPMGTTGEFYAIDDEEYECILKETVNIVKGRVDIYAGANHITTRGAIKLAQIAEKIEGIDALSVLTPMFISQTQSEIYNFFKTIAENTSLPVIIYNNKPKTNVTVDPETIAKLAEIPNIIGVKDSTGDFTNTEEYLRLTKHIDDFSVLLGRDTLIYAGMCHGATGAISSCANVAPRITADIYDKYVAGDFQGALEAQFKLAPLRIACNMGTFPATIKEALNQIGIPVGKCIAPIAELSQNQKESLNKILKEMNLM